MTSVVERLSAALADRYRIERELGAGGMATVYLAEDLKHDRKVAIKVLKPELAAVLGAERFVVEIKTTAAMSHPHILPLFDSGTADGFLFYVMPYIKGETIREKLNRETQFGVDEAVRIAREVADALDYAHRHGVIHRDIKPENILLHDGQAMVMDFGIALAVSAAAGGRMTETGLSLGTPHYMSPEQATAEKEITGRSDQYSLASVLYEMLAGQPPHIGGAAQQVIMRIITEPARAVSEFRRNVPPNVVAAVAKALEKLPADRFESAKTFAGALGNPTFTSASTSGTGVREHSAAGVSARLYWATAVVALLATGLAAALWLGREAEQPRAIARFEIRPEGDATVTAITADRELSISPDGSRIAYVGNDGRQLFIRAMDALTFTPLGGNNELPRGPFFSPDGAWVGFFAGGTDGPTLSKIAVTGGPALPITKVDGSRLGATWGEDGTIVFATADSTSGLWLVSADGGAPVRLTTPDRGRGELDHVFPSFLPGGRAVLFTITPTSGGIEGASVAALDLQTGTYKVVVRGGSDARYVSSGHIVFGGESALRAVRFDPGRLEAIGTPTTVLESVATRSGGAAQFDVAGNGTLIYVPDIPDMVTDLRRTLVWVDRQGREAPIKAPSRSYRIPRLSPDGGRVALEIADEERDIWVLNLATENLARITFGPRRDYSPVWMPDGQKLIMTGEGGLHLKAADGTGAPELISSVPYEATSTSADGRIVVRSSAYGGSVRAVVRGKDGGTPEDLVVGGGLWRNGEVSPDGRWLAYEGAQSGQPQIFVRPFPEVARGLWQVTTAGGSKPLWARNGKELFFLDPTGALMSVRVEAGTTWNAGAPVKVFDGSYFVGANGRTYDVSPDGRRFLMIKPAVSEAAVAASTARPAERGMIVVQHWDEVLRRLVPKP